MDWSRIARETIGKVHASLPDDATLAQRKAALKAAYPFGEREYWPYKAWLKAQRDYLAKVCAPESPTQRAAIIAKAGSDISFPFADDTP